jgi:2-amino-4-hydroxy-6-hydroxymethyldihydropteridine diphosphokinase
MTTAYIALGSNMNDPEHQLQQAINAINTWPGSSITAVSRAYNSAAVGPGEQADYLNAVMALTTELSPSALLRGLQAQENHQGRVRTVRWGARTLDLDIILYGKQMINTKTLQIPHPAMAERHFVLYPLAEIAGEKLKLPGGSELATLLRNCPRGELAVSPALLYLPPKTKQQGTAQGVRPE